MSVLIIKSNSKVNIGLNILNLRSDGYHNINTIFQEIDFHDTLIVEKQNLDLIFLPMLIGYQTVMIIFALKHGKN